MTGDVIPFEWFCDHYLNCPYGEDEDDDICIYGEIYKFNIYHTRSTVYT